MLKQWWLKWREPKPFNEGYLPEADGHRIYFAEYGKKEIPLARFSRVSFLRLL